MKIVSTLALALSLSLAACGGTSDNTVAPANSVAAAPAPAGQDWRETVNKTAEGFVVGNPNAAVKLVEYGARLCPACKQFSIESHQPLMNTYVATGKVSFEFRDFLIHGPPELGLAVLARCADKAAFFPILEQTYIGQDALNQKMVSVPPAQQQALQKGTPAQVMAGWTEAIGGIEFMKQRGLPDTQARQCLADTKVIDEITAVTQKAGANGTVTGTPTLIVNGTKVDGISWTAVEAALKKAGA